jgi:N-acetylmuramoyl-L-alanine amidase
MFSNFIKALVLSSLLVLCIPAIATANEVSDLPTRIEGKDRFEVASNIAQKWQSAEVAVLSNYLAFADALTASPLAYKYDAPILLTHPNSLTDITRKELIRLGTSKVYIIGGEGSISTQIANELQGMGIEVIRIGGIDRFEVAVNVAKEIGVPNGQLVVANGLVFADALTIAPFASVNQYPILLTRNNQLPENIDAFIKSSSVSKTIVVGGEGSVSAGVFNVLPFAERIGGKDRYEVAANISNKYGQNSQKIYLATGLTFADALTGSVVAAKESAAVLLTPAADIPQGAASIIKTKNSPITILGGNGSVSDKIIYDITNLRTSNRPVVYIVPHQDDEILSYGIDIRNELSKGRDVHLVLLSKGEESGARDIINGTYDFESYAPYLAGQRVKCQWHNTYHDPSKERYYHGRLSPDEFGDARTDEYYRASKALGVKPENIHTEFISRGSYDGVNVRNVIEKYLASYPDADIRAFSWVDGHSAHALIGRTLRGMQEEGYIQRYRAQYLVSIYTDRFYSVSMPVQTIKIHLNNQADKNFLTNAISEYKRFEPAKGIYAVGYHSVTSQFESLEKNIYGKIHY